ncbi:hypothetical protein JI749_13320 [Devosia oryziradicis]|uniref:Capsule biosynthesis protein n=1 Tax=Devosia oryziradicis TaxID=2801335 RepID=A0ABX7BTP1_9HYPH|nr:hypothetical protein [Devosia oryziradicis]QQR35329.1 hypothetical protein JI749_13320 [Devosia oryziradicis]
MMQSKAIYAEPEVAEMIQDFEQRSGAFAIREGGVSLWRLMRFEASVQLQNLELRRAAIPRSQLMRSLPRAAWQFAFAKRGLRYIGKTSNSGLRDKRNGTYRDIYFDDLVDAVPGGAMFSSLDTAGFEEASRNAHRQPVFDDTAVVISSAVLGRLLGRRPPSPASAQLAGLIADGLGLSEFTPARVQQKYDVFRWRAAIYKKVLRRFGVGIVLAANTGLHSLIAAARSVGIPYVEIQHGDFGEHHPESLPTSALKTGLEGLLLPDRLAVFGERDLDRLSGTALGQLGRLRAVGAPAIANGRALRESNFRADPALPVITFTSQGFALDQVDRFITDFLAISHEPFRLIIRLHPGYEGDGANYRSIAETDPRLIVMPGDAAPATHEVIALSDLHLSISSTCHYDALGIGTPTRVLGLPGHASMAELVDTGMAKRIDTPEQLALVVKQRDWGSVTAGQSSYFFKPGYIDNMVELLAELDVGTQ